MLNQRSKRSLPASEQSVGGLPQGMFGGQSEQGSDVGTEEEEFVSAALGSGGACLFIWTARTMHAEALSEAAGHSSSLSLRWCVLVW